MQKSDFTFNDKDQIYQAEINGMEVDINDKNMSDETIGFAAQIAQAYPGKLDEIAKYLSQDEDMRIFFGDLSKEEIIAGLNMPILRVFKGENGQLTYCNHVFDDIHVIDLEFSGVLEEFSYITIDG